MFLLILPQKRALIAHQDGIKRFQTDSFVCPVFQEPTRHPTAPLLVTIATKAGFKMYRATPHVVNVQMDLSTPQMAPWAAMSFHQARTMSMALTRFANVVTRVPATMPRDCRVQMVRTPTPRAPSLAFLVHRVNFPAKREMLNATNVQRGIYNLNRNNQNVIQSKLDQSWPKEDLPR